MNRRYCVVAHPTLAKAQPGFVNHDLQGFRAIGQPPAEGHIHGFRAESVRYPLEEKAAGFGITV